MNSVVRFLISAILITAHQASADGGAIGGGEVRFRSVASCDGFSIVSNFRTSLKLEIIAEVDYGGRLLSRSPLKVKLTYPGKKVDYLQTLTLLSQLDLSNLKIYRWSDVVPGQSNPLLAQISIMGSTGGLRSFEYAGNSIELKNCVKNLK